MMKEAFVLVDFSKDCSILFFFDVGEGESIMMHYERPQYMDDHTLNDEAKTNAKDIIEKNLHGAKELIAIGIARSEIQRKDILNKINKNSSCN